MPIFQCIVAITLKKICIYYFELLFKYKYNNLLIIFGYKAKSLYNNRNGIIYLGHYWWIIKI